MRRLGHLMLILTVIWCGSHLCEPAQAQVLDAGFSLMLDEHVSPDRDDSGESQGKLAHGGHHHCPIAADQHAAADNVMIPSKAPAFACRTAALHSLSHAPPLQPPSA